MNVERKEQTGLFHELGPDRVLNLVEKELGIQCNNLFRPLNSYINRVYEVESIEKTRYIVKFYRPGRWTKEAILEEHGFLLDLAEQEVPVIAPLLLHDNSTLAECENLHFCVFPKCGGRSVDEFNDEEWLQLGRLIGRAHKVGESRNAQHRIVMAPQESTFLHNLISSWPRLVYLRKLKARSKRQDKQLLMILHLYSVAQNLSGFMEIVIFQMLLYVRRNPFF